MVCLECEKLLSAVLKSCKDFGSQCNKCYQSEYDNKRILIRNVEVN
jgi:hypothetical protein